MKARHQGDLVWRFQHAREEIDALPGTLAFARTSADDPDLSPAEAHLAAGERMERISAVLIRLPTTPVNLAQVLCLRYGPDESVPEIRLVLRENAAVATTTREATTCFARFVGDHRAHPDDVRDWLAALCGRIVRREASGADTVALDEVRRGAETSLAEAERAYERAAEGRESSDGKGERTTETLKAFYTVPELARALGMSRWTVRRWLDAKQIPYELRRRQGGTRQGRIVVLLSELRTYAPSYFSSIRGELGKRR